MTDPIPTDIAGSTEPVTLDGPADEATAMTAGEEDHSNPVNFTGDAADAPGDTGRPPSPEDEAGWQA